MSNIKSHARRRGARSCIDANSAACCVRGRRAAAMSWGGRADREKESSPPHVLDPALDSLEGVTHHG